MNTFKNNKPPDRLTFHFEPGSDKVAASLVGRHTLVHPCVFHPQLLYHQGLVFFHHISTQYTHILALYLINGTKQFLTRIATPCYWVPVLGSLLINGYIIFYLNPLTHNKLGWIGQLGTG